MSKNTLATCKVFSNKSDTLNNYYEFRKSLKSGDSVLVNLHYQTGTTLEAKFLSDKIEVEKWKIESNFSSNPLIKTISVAGNFACYADDNCEITKAEITSLSGTKTDITEAAKKAKNHPFAAMDLFYLVVPANTQNIKIFYK